MQMLLALLKELLNVISVIWLKRYQIIAEGTSLWINVRIVSKVLQVLL